MVFGNYSVSYPADEHYPPESSIQTLSIRNATQIFTGARSMVNLYAANTGAGLVWLGVWDDNPIGSPSTGARADHRLITLAPVAGPGWFQFSVHGGTDVQFGLWVGAYSTAALALAGGDPDAGDVMFYKADWNASKVLPQV